MKPDGHVKILCALVNLRGRERNGAFGLDARVGKMGRGSADSTKSGVERRHFKFSKDASSGEPSLPELALRVTGNAMAGSLGDRESLKVGIPKGTPFGVGSGPTRGPVE
jgi:hypothetical protein